ncbi:MAG: hypothetical protein ABWZ40_13185 [Caulobacterales bacterium]
MSKEPFRGAVQSSVHYERLICEVRLNEAYGLIVSEETPGQYMVSISSFIPSQEKIYDECLNVPESQMSVEFLIETLRLAVERLKKMDAPQFDI